MLNCYIGTMDTVSCFCACGCFCLLTVGPPLSRRLTAEQALGKAQAREQAELWGRGNTRNEAASGRRRGETEDNRRSGGYRDGGDTSGRGEHLGVGVPGREMQQQQHQQQQRAKELELEITLARERQAAATKDLERSEVPFVYALNVCEG